MFFSNQNNWLPLRLMKDRNTMPAHKNTTKMGQNKTHLKGFVYIGCHGHTKVSIDFPDGALYLPWCAIGFLGLLWTSRAQMLCYVMLCILYHLMD